MFTQGNRHYTWWSHREGTRPGDVGRHIDYFLVSEVLAPKVLAAEVHDGTTGSDHCPMSATLDVEVS